MKLQRKDNGKWQQFDQHITKTIPNSSMFERRGKQYPHPSSCSPHGGDFLY
jgi:hypothetical protein